ncbi:hypothetical protein DERP_004792 [Dermatophagoides pteronyssinus]|uniref:Uncharacterized protein n=1 Tax=Dermatophagoides pteronyssinus TaxID=6956 RepID=A0ABQ8JSJ5_DERPT|nr:hypothetical protein DERP_004792 [Dermatophagoides pteronyssinus]
MKRFNDKFLDENDQNSKRIRIDYDQNDESESKSIDFNEKSEESISDEEWFKHIAKYIKSSYLYTSYSEIHSITNYDQKAIYIYDDIENKDYRYDISDNEQNDHYYNYYEYDDNNFSYDTDLQIFDDGTMAIIINENERTTENNDESPKKNKVIRRPSNISIKITPNLQQHSIESIQIVEMPAKSIENTQIQSCEVTSNSNGNATCQTAALMLSTNGNNYVLSLNIKPTDKKEQDLLNIHIPNKKIGEKLEKFLEEYGFQEYLDEKSSKITTNTDFDYRTESIAESDDEDAKSTTTTASIYANQLCRFRRRRSTTFVPTEFISHVKNDQDFFTKFNQKYIKDMFHTNNLAHLLRRPFQIFRGK